MRDNLNFYSIKERIFIVKTFYMNDCDFNAVKHSYIYEYGEADDIPTDSLIFEIVNLFEETGSIKELSISNEEEDDVVPEIFIGYDGIETIVTEMEEEDAEHPIEVLYEALDSVDMEENSLPPVPNNEDNTSSKRRRMPKKMWTEWGVKSTKPTKRKHNRILQKLPHKGGFNCEICNKKCTSELGLKQHVAGHVDKPPQNCKYCEEYFTTIYKLRAHMEVNHPDAVKREREARENRGKTAYNCDECSKSYSNASQLKRHKVTHSDTPAYVCHICGQGMKNKSNLPVHMTIHTGEKPVRCQFPNCTRTFRTLGSYKVHERSHTNERPYICETCGKGFRDASSRRVHQLQHTGENPFKCELCGKETKQRQNLKSHMRHFHKMNT